MGMRTIIVYGYGVDDNELMKISDNALIQFIKKHLPKVYDEMMEDVESDASCEDCIAWFDDYENSDGEMGVYGVIADVMKQELDMCFEYRKSEYDEALMFAEQLPWCYSEKERACTKEQLDKIFQLYFSELGVGNVVLSTVSLEYLG